MVRRFREDPPRPREVRDLEEGSLSMGIGSSDSEADDSAMDMQVSCLLGCMRIIIFFLSSLSLLLSSLCLHLSSSSPVTLDSKTDRIAGGVNFIPNMEQVQNTGPDAIEKIANTSPLESLDDLLASAKRTLDTASLWDPLHWDAKSDRLMTSLLSTSPPASPLAHFFEKGIQCIFKSMTLSFSKGL